MAMKDGAALSLLKRLVAGLWRIELAVRRVISRPRWELVGACTHCGKCCVQPSIRAGAFTWYLPMLRRLFLAWQRRVNGFTLLTVERGTRTFVFQCAHHEATTGRCDSYASRPGMCRDYPRVLLDQGWPELFDTCGFRTIARNAPSMRAAIDATALSDEEKAELRRKLRLD
jgi:hypothetical protein